MTVAGSITILATGMMVAAVLTFGNMSVAAAGPIEDANRKTVLAFNDLAFRDHQAKKAAELYLGDVYIQHNPCVPNGPEAFATFFSKFSKEHPTASVEIKRVIAEGDLVVVHSHFKLTPDATGSAAVDIFRLEKGRIVEHWDVLQDVPATPSPNGNTMFDGNNFK
jgi:predicted SnoaL-like aldol condensation-catalyzing enzyme